MKKDQKVSLKDELYNKKKIEYLSKLISQAYPKFEKKKFIKNILNKLPQLELKERIFWIQKNLEIFLPESFEKAVRIILKSLPRELDNTKTDNDFGEFIFAPFGYFVSEHGCNRKDLKTSFNALARLTKNFSVEDPIRFFINKFPNETFMFIQQMSQSTNYHQRRLSSECLRPKLPWCVGINFELKKAVSILDILYCDTTRYVVRSVANHLNDISKINPDFVIEILKRWEREGMQEKKEFEYLKYHSLRTSIKKGHKKTLVFLGFSLNPQIKIKNFLIKNNKIKLGEYLIFSFDVFVKKKENIIINYIITYPSKTSRKSQKIFRIKKMIVKKEDEIFIKKRQLFKRMTTKKLYSGKYVLQIQINGKIFNEHEFFLEF